ncbi:MAG TPA: hypothetical protein VFQ12_05800 [Thermoleophilaceae bacterium]|nr:hypothetical protein [Thermoleophilaceae bacterium]
MRGRHLITATAALSSVALALPAAGSACDAGRRERPAKPAGTTPLAVGDSVMLGAVTPLVAAGFEVDARGCRQMDEGVKLLAARGRAGTLSPVVVVALGTNWIVSTAHIRRALRILGPNRVLGLVTPRELNGATTADQVRIRAAGRRWRRRVRVLDWVRYSAGRDTWFAGDGLHLGPAGRRGFTRLLRRALAWPVPSLTATWTPEPRAQAAEQLSPDSALPAGR